jgi:ATP-binding cassette subfamily C protein
VNLRQDLALLMEPGDRAKLAVLVLLIVISGVLEVAGIGLIFPYVALLQEPQRIAENRYLAELFHVSGLSTRGFLLGMSGALLATFCIKGAFALWLQRMQLSFANGKQVQLGRRLLGGYLSQPYAFFLSANTSSLIGNLTTSLTQLCGGLITAALNLAAELIVLAGLVAVLLVLNPVLTLAGMAFVGMIAMLFMRAIRPSIRRYAAENSERWKAMIRAVNEGLSAAKEIQVLGNRDFFVEVYDRESRAFAQANTRYALLNQMPRVTLETAAVAGMVLFAVFAILAGAVGKNLFAVLAVFAVATIRIVPSANRILQAVNAIGFYAPSIEIVARGVGAVRDAPPALEAPGVDVSFRERLSIQVTRFSYPEASRPALQDIRLEIRQGQRIAFIGHSGSGKTTLIDVILGLFPEFEGRIEADGREIRENVAAWRRHIGYIPQNIYLCDDTILHNVCFGVPREEIDLGRAEEAIRLAGLESVVRAQPEGLKTIVGDRGVRLSGGERQRIGIARALYHDPDLLILDEATSALDNVTERRIVDSILGMTPAKTVILIAHRLTTAERCDQVYLMHGGRIIDQGLFAEVAERNREFVKPSGAVAAQAHG